MNRSISALAATFALVGSSHAAIILDNFNSYNEPGDNMQGKGGWTVTNDSVNVPVILDTFTWDGSDRSATIGGVAPGGPGLTSLSNYSTVQLEGVTMRTAFEIETAYTESTGLDPRNNFQFILNSGVHNLLTIRLEPDAAGQYSFSWDSEWVAGGFSTFGTLTAATPTQFRFETWWNGSNVAYELTNAGLLVSDGVLAGTGVSPTAVIDTFSAQWDTSNGVGSNSLTIDNVSLVPEPSAALLGLLGASFALVRRRRA